MVRKGRLVGRLTSDDVVEGLAGFDLGPDAFDRILQRFVNEGIEVVDVADIGEADCTPPYSDPSIGSEPSPVLHRTERRLATFLFRGPDQCHVFMDVENYNQYSFPPDQAKIGEMELRDGCEVVLTLDGNDNLIAVEPAEAPEHEEVLHRIFESVSDERFDSTYIKVLHQNATELQHLKNVQPEFRRAIYIYRNDPVALVVEFTKRGTAYCPGPPCRVPLADLVREIPRKILWKSVFESEAGAYQGPYGEQAERAYRELSC
ncbi:MAG: hypothetical protein KIS61_16645 [Candidatus Eremiobacteraeota bacterium]|nr:hypothetical protein [Candidatus Eremiobacteraeota bacterium]